jgi:hypothetical protein
MGSSDKMQRMLTDVRSASGRRSLAVRMVGRLNNRIRPELTDSHLLPRDIVDDAVFAPPTSAMVGGQRLRVGWVISPPVPGSGGSGSDPHSDTLIGF